MKTKLATGLLIAVLVAAAAMRIFGGKDAPPRYVPPDDAVVTVFPAAESERDSVIIEAATDVSYMRPFINQFQMENSGTTIVYVDFISSTLLRRATDACKTNGMEPDLYLTVSTDHLVELANHGCGAPVPKDVADKVTRWAQWRREVIAFAVEPAVIVYNTDMLEEADVPRSHVDLIELLRSEKYDWEKNIGTYDIEESGLGYNYAAFDARHSTIYGRLVESLGRVKVRTYCCSSIIIDSVAERKIMLAYNVQMSYAYAAQQEGKPIGVVLPMDYQAIQTRSVMLTRQPRHPDAAVAFIDFLVSPFAQQLAYQGLVSPSNGGASDVAVSAHTFAQASVGPSLLALRDHARRTRLINEWRSAILPPDDDAPRRTPAN
jgi:iron(III) transport system substrate-binding protein